MKTEEFEDKFAIDRSNGNYLLKVDGCMKRYKDNKDAYHTEEECRRITGEYKIDNRYWVSRDLGTEDMAENVKNDYEHITGDKMKEMMDSIRITPNENDERC